jgi:hypothetical protein
MAAPANNHGATAPIVMIKDEDGNDEYVYLAEGPPGMALSDAVASVGAAIRAAKANPQDVTTGYTFEDLEREIDARGLRMVPSYATADERW